MSFSDKLYTFQLQARQTLVGKYYQYVNPQTKSDGRLDFPPQKVLFVLTGLIGDSIMTTPVIIKARELWKDAHFTLLGRKSNCELLAACPLIDEFREQRSQPFSLRNYKDIKELKKWLIKENFDVSIILFGDHFGSILAQANVPVRVGVSESEASPTFTHTYKIGTPRTWSSTERLNSLRALGYSFENIKPKLWVADSAKITAKQKLEDCGLPVGQSYIVLHPFGSTERQRLDLNQIPQIATELQKKYNLHTVIIGGAEMTRLLNNDLEKLIINTVGKLTLQELLAVINDARLVVTTDSGPYHIAGALGKSIVGLFRARRPEHSAHYSDTRIIFGTDDACNATCRWDYCQTIPCRQMDGIKAESIINVLYEML